MTDDTTTCDVQNFLISSIKIIKRSTEKCKRLKISEMCTSNSFSIYLFVYLCTR